MKKATKELARSVMESQLTHLEVSLRNTIALDEKSSAVFYSELVNKYLDALHDLNSVECEA